MSIVRVLSLMAIIALAVGVLATGALVAADRPIDGQIGNLNDPVPPYIPDLITGNQSFAYLVFPDQQVNCEEGGCILERVNMYFKFTEEQVPQTFNVSGGFLVAEPVPGSDGFVPGEPICTSPTQTVTITAPGLQIVSVPMAGVCDCLPVDQPYFLTLNLLDPVAANLVEDGRPEAGVAYWNNGQLWEDLNDVDRTSDGKIIIWGDILCCLLTVGDEATTWDDVKALFR